MSKDGYLPDNVTHQMIEGHFGGQEDEGAEINLANGRIALVRLSDQILAIEVFNLLGELLPIQVLEFSLADARALAMAINERVM